jgi:release factor glutamine methyltransferase
MQHRIRLLEGDLFAPIDRDKKYDLIISNPPYIPTNDIPSLSKEVQAEPLLALDGGMDGLSILRRIIHDSLDFLKPGGSLILEINGKLQEKKITQLFYEHGYRKVFQKKDLASIPRVIGGSKC